MQQRQLIPVVTQAATSALPTGGLGGGLPPPPPSSPFLPEQLQLDNQVTSIKKKDAILHVQ
ncbi:hypothetical protein [Paraflavitalea speifideaquila]|uniref:hypothetical protein n=1 Tax=Paraflavitalea speifideaquila TaxID=3076558 RepID=UPI0028EE4CFA|nr:hypothetical protein [Paraflavitalea speifideiaquila]